MYKDVPEDLMTKIKEVAGIINEHDCAVDTMLIAVGNNYYGYQPQPQPDKKPASEVPNERLTELGQAFEEAQASLAKENVELLVCFVSLNEGSATIFVAQEAVNRRLEIFKELKKMEEHHAKIS